MIWPSKATASAFLHESEKGPKYDTFSFLNITQEWKGQGRSAKIVSQ